MTINYTTLLGLVQPVDGTEVGTWGDDVNNGISSILDVAVAGTQTLSTDANATLTITQATSSGTNLSGTSAQYAILLLSGARSATRTVTLPASSKTYLVINNTTGGFSQTVGGLTIAVGEYCTIVYNTSTSAWAKVSNNLGTTAINTLGTVTTGTWNGSTVGIAYGGTGATTLAGANIPVTNVANTFTATQTFSGSTSTFATSLLNAAEPATVSATAATGTINFYINSQSVLYYTSNASANWTLNVAFSSGTSLNTAMSTGQTVTIAFLVTQGSTAYYESVFQIDGTNVTPKWQGGAAPSKGNASGIDVYTYTITKTASATYTVLASQTQFK